ncbi:alpha/beta fold hydrolase [Myxococcaceae bacterium GXIMD 01537]
MLDSTPREIPLHTLEGVPDADVTTHYFATGDGLGLSMLRFLKDGAEDGEDAVLIVHGLTTSSDMFIMPEHQNLVRYLHEQGYGDVWTLDNRMSNRHPYNLLLHRFNMDDMALYDYPEALREMRRHTGAKRVHVIAHCLGSVSFAMSLFGGQVKDLASVTFNSTSLTPRVPRWSRFKLAVAPFSVEYLIGLPYMNPRWSEDPKWTKGRLFSKLVSAIHRECDVPACHMLSTMWGTGFPALYSHENLLGQTHRRGGQLYGGTSVHYYRHVRKMVRAGHAVKMRPGDAKYAALPDDYLEHAGDITTPVLFMTGARNDVFTDSNIHAHRLLEERFGPASHRELRVFRNYGHQDVFMGKRVHRDIFPSLVDFMDRHGRKARGHPRPSRAAHEEEAPAVVH